MMTELSVVGKSIIRTDSLTKVLGKAEYCTDIKLPGMLCMKVLRSPHPHARILSIDTSKAQKVPGVRCIITGEDGPRELWGSAMIKDRPVLARDVVRYVGTPVAAVAAETLEAAKDAVELISVRYEELPAVFDVEAAASKNPPVIVHPDFPDYTKYLPAEKLDPDRPNVFHHMKIRRGNIEDGFREADLIMENRFSTPPIQHCPLEPHAVVVRPEPDGGITVFTSRQNIWGTQGEVADIFNIKPTKVRVIQPYVGGAFGGKGESYELLAVLMALKCRRPVKWVYTREEEFIDGGQREAVVIYIKDGMKKDGTLVAREMKAFVNGGAYEGYVGIITKNASWGAIPLYRSPNFKWDSYGTYTNEPARGAFRGFGVVETIFAIESNMDMMAEKLGMDPVELRRKNILKEGEPHATGEIAHSIGVEECMDEVVRFINLDEKSPDEGPWKKGKGIAIGSKYSTAPALCQAKIKVTADESIIIYHSANELGQGVNTVMAQIAAEEFGVSVDDIQVVFTDTAITPYFAEGSTSSRTTYNLGIALRLACTDAKRILFQQAAKKLGTSPDEMETRGKRIYVKANPEKSIRVTELFMPYRGQPTDIFGGAADCGEIIGNATYFQDYVPEDPETGQIDETLAKQGKRLNAFYAYVAKAVEVAVNTETGQVKVIKCCGGNDVGKALNPKMCEQQSEGGIYMGLSVALYEELIMEKGKVLNPSFVDYRTASMKQMPSMENVKSFFIESAPHKDAPYGAKGFGEGAMVGMEAAIANAVYNAVGVRIKEIPITPERVLRALREKDSAK